MGDTVRLVNGQCSESIAEPLISLRVLQHILLVFDSLYGLFYLCVVVLAIGLQCYSRTELALYSVVFALNVANALAIGLFLLGITRRKLALIRLYQIINGGALAVQLLGCIYFFGLDGSISY